MNPAAPAPSRRPPPRIRWWPAVFFLAATAGSIVWVRFFWDVHQQDRNVWTYLLCGVCFLCLVLWLMVLSNLPRRTRWRSLGWVALVHLLVIGMVRIKGVDGNLVPVLEWRWTSGAARATDSPARPAGIGDRGASLLELDGWPQFLGPNRDGCLDGIQLETDWERLPPRELWRVPVRAGWSGFAVARGFAVTQEQVDGQESIVALDALTGERLWTHSYAARYATTIAGEGPRATPAIADGRVYASGATGWLVCVDLNRGSRLWARNALEENGGRVPEWGFSVSPLVVDDRVILSLGGSDGRSLVAFDARSGEPLWAGGADGASYSSPVPGTLHGHRQVVVFNHSSVAGHDLQTGQLLWEQPYAAGHVHVATPLILDSNRVLVSSGYGHGSELIAIQIDDALGWSAQRVWKSRRMKAKFTNLIPLEGFIYGLDDGILACISAETGELRWKDGRYGHGQVILAGRLLLVMTEGGDLVLVEPNPDTLRERARWSVFSGKTWNPPALAGRHLFVRTDREAVCVELPVAD